MQGLFLVISYLLVGLAGSCIFSSHREFRDIPLSNPMGVYWDVEGGEIYIADPGNRSIFIYSEEGIPLYRIQHNINSRDKVGEPADVAVDKDGLVYVIDHQVDYIDVLNPRGLSVNRIDLSKFQDLEGLEITPVCITIDREGNIYVGVDGSDAFVVVLDSSFSFIRRVGRRGKREGEFQHITGLFVDKDLNLYVTDIDAYFCVQVFDSTGNYQFGFGKHKDGWENFSFPKGVAVTSDGTIWVVDALRQVVKGFNKKGEFVTFIGGKGTKPGEMLFPSDIFCNGDSELVVVERVGKRFQIFRIE